MKININENMSEKEKGILILVLHKHFLSEKNIKLVANKNIFIEFENENIKVSFDRNIIIRPSKHNDQWRFEVLGDWLGTGMVGSVSKSQYKIKIAEDRLLLTLSNKRVKEFKSDTSNPNWAEDLHNELTFNRIAYLDPSKQSGSSRRSHLNISEQAQQAHLVMPFVDGQPLSSNLIQHLNYMDRLRLCISIISSLENLHINNFLHRDIKPDNIIINLKKLTATFIDFGLAHYISDPGNNRFVGNLKFMAPEIFQENIEMRKRHFKTQQVQEFNINVITDKSDIYGLAGILYFLLGANLEDSHPERGYDKHGFMVGDIYPKKDKENLGSLLENLTNKDANTRQPLIAVKKYLVKLLNKAIEHEIGLTWALNTNSQNVSQLRVSDSHWPDVLMRPECYVIDKNDYKSLLQFLKENSIFLRYKDKDGNSLLHKAILQDDLPLFKVLLAARAHPNLRNNEGFIPLHYCLMGFPSNYLEMIVRLLPNSDCHLKNNMDLHALDLAVKTGKQEVINRVHAKFHNYDYEKNETVDSKLLTSFSNISKKDEESLESFKTLCKELLPAIDDIASFARIVMKINHNPTKNPVATKKLNFFSRFIPTAASRSREHDYYNSEVQIEPKYLKTINTMCKNRYIEILKKAHSSDWDVYKDSIKTLDELLNISSAGIVKKLRPR